MHMFSEVKWSCSVMSDSSVTPWTVARQAPPSMGFSRQEHWSGLPFPSPGDLPNPGVEPRSPTLQTDSLPAVPPGKPVVKRPPANADMGDLGLIPGWGRCPGEGHGNPLSVLAWRIPWTEKPGGLQVMGSQRVGLDWSNLAHTLHLYALHLNT